MNLTSDEHLRVLSLCISPYLKELRLRQSGSDYANYRDPQSEWRIVYDELRLAQVEHLQLTSSYSYSELGPWNEITRICRDHLKTVEVSCLGSECPAVGDILIELAAAPKLVRMSFLGNARTYATFIPEVAFPSLRGLEMMTDAGYTPKPSPVMFGRGEARNKYFECPPLGIVNILDLPLLAARLESITLQIGDTDRDNVLTVWQQMIDAVGNACTGLQRLNVSTMRRPRQNRPQGRLNLARILRRPTVEVLAFNDIRASYVLPPTDSDLLDMAEAWPKLRFLGWMGRDYLPEEVTATVMSLRYFAERCPSLQGLRITINTILEHPTDKVANPLDRGEGRFKALESLNVRQWIIAEASMQRLARVLGELMPVHLKGVPDGVPKWIVIGSTTEKEKKLNMMRANICKALNAYLEEQKSFER